MGNARRFKRKKNKEHMHGCDCGDGHEHSHAAEPSLLDQISRAVKRHVAADALKIGVNEQAKKDTAE